MPHDDASLPNGEPRAFGKKRGRRPLKPQLRDARAGLILQRRLAQIPPEEIAREFNISRSTVFRALKDAERLGLHTRTRDWLTTSAVPLALVAIEDALLSNDIHLRTETAFNVLDRLGITGKHATLTIQAGKQEESFEAFRARVVESSGHPSLPAPGDGEILE
jgi:DNA-binding MarR family transcriptional regulator